MSVEKWEEFELKTFLYARSSQIIMNSACLLCVVQSQRVHYVLFALCTSVSCGGSL